MDLHIGDRVRMTIDDPKENSNIRAGDTGTVCRIFPGIVGVEWDHKVRNGHSCGQTCEDGYGWGVLKCEIELCHEDEKTQSDINENAFFKIIS